MIRTISVVAVALSGLVHLVLAPQHYAHAPAHGIFFALAGVAEIAWALAFWRRPSLWLYRVGVGLAGGLVILWAVTRVFPAPFEGEPGAVDLAGLFCKTGELVAVATLVILALQGRLETSLRRPRPRVAVEALALAWVVGMGTLMIGYAAEPLLPALSGQAGHGGVDDHAAGGPSTSQQHPHEQADGTDEAAPQVDESNDHTDGSHAEGDQPGVRANDAWARPAPSGGNDAVYVVVNGSARPDRLLHVRTEVATRAELHETTMEDDVAAMRAVSGGIEVPAGGRVELKPGGLHVMLVGLTRDLTPGDRFQIELEFEEAGRVTTEVEVRQP